MKNRGLYDGGFLILVGMFFIAVGIVTFTTGVKKADKAAHRHQKEADKAFVIPLREEEKVTLEEKNPSMVYIEKEKKEEDVHYEIILPAEEPKPAETPKPWYWPF